MKYFVFSLLWCLFSLQAAAQEDEMARANREFFFKVSRQLQLGRYDQATRLVDEALENSPRSPTAWMMRGNILLSYCWQKPGQQYLDVVRAENIFDTTTALLRFQPVLSEDTSRMIEKSYRKALQEDSSNAEYIKAICYLLAVSLRTEDLKNEMERLYGHIQYMEDAPSVMNDYARLLIERGHVEDGMEIYRRVAKWFSNDAAPMADIAVEYLQQGKTQQALAYADSTLRFPVVDEQSLQNMAMIYSTLTYYDQALQTYRRSAKKYKNVSDLFYKGLLLYAEGKQEAQDSLMRFLGWAELDRYLSEIPLAEYVRDSGIGFNETALYMMTFSSTPIQYAIPVLQRGLRSADSIVACMSAWRMGKLYGESQLWDLVRNLTEGNECDPPELTASIIWGYAAYRQGLWAEAEKEWLNAPETDPGLADMKYYFLARICQQTNRPVECQAYRNKISPQSQAKYATLARYITWNP